MKRGRGRPRIHFPPAVQPELPLGWQHLVTASQGKPGSRITSKRSGGLLRLRLTILDLRDRNLLGRRIKVSLKTRCPQEAEIRKGILLAGFRKAGLIEHLRGDITPYLEDQPPEGEDVILGPADLADILRRRREDFVTPPPAPQPDPGNPWANR